MSETGTTSQQVRQESLAPGAVVSGAPESDVTVVAVAWHGTSAITLTYRTESGQTGERLLYRGDERTLRVMQG